jgi:hypothetical protein
MQQFTQKYAIIQLFEEVPEGTQFSWKDWPLHSTVVDVFAINWDMPATVQHLEKLLASRAKATSIAEEDEFFGPEKQTQVVLLQKTDSLVKLHHDVVEMLEEGGLTLNDPQFAREGFLPHSTVQKHNRLHKGDAVIFNALTIIDMFPGGDPYQRKVLKTIQIGSPE